MAIVIVLFWVSAGALIWTHAAYPIAARAVARVRRRTVRRSEDVLPTVAVIVAAHNEESVIARRVENLKALADQGMRMEHLPTEQYIRS